jgi:uncharacterized flavoprotein (TIGR03862 family)
MAAEVLATAGVRVVVLERMASVGRKFLLAGRGGLNLTHTENLATFVGRYGQARDRLAAAIEAFGPDDLRAWCAGLGEEPFVGSSGRVFPAQFRATPLLRAWRARLESLGVDIRVRTPWTGWDSTPDADVVVLALGGASWPNTGSDGAWVGAVAASGIAVSPLRPSNCGFVVEWSGVFRTRFAGAPLKNVTLAFGGDTARGDAVIAAGGIEGGPVYALSAALRDAIERDGTATLHVDLLPDVAVAALEARLERRRRGDSVANWLRRAGVSPVGVALLREGGDPLPEDAAAMARVVKRVAVQLVAAQSIERAISTAGGIALSEIDDSFMLRRRPGTFVAGEMLDWEAPTGGYLLQATFSTAVAAANGALAWLERADR